MVSFGPTVRSPSVPEITTLLPDRRVFSTANSSWKRDFGWLAALPSSSVQSARPMSVPCNVTGPFAVLLGPGSPVVGFGPGSTFVSAGAVLRGDEDDPP